MLLTARELCERIFERTGKMPSASDPYHWATGGVLGLRLRVRYVKRKIRFEWTDYTRWNRAIAKARKRGQKTKRYRAKASVV
jgi:hypothetical protein